MFWSGFLLIAFGVAIWLWASARSMTRASYGPKIGPRAGTAVVLVDLQTVFWNDARYSPTLRARVEAAVAREVALAQHEDQPVIALRQEWSGPGPRLMARVLRQGKAVQGSAGTELAPPFAKMADHVVVKRVEDGFETGELDALLDVLGIGALRILGCDGEGAVARTAQGALNRNYRVTLVADAIATEHPGAFASVAGALTSQGAQVARGELSAPPEASGPANIRHK